MTKQNFALDQYVRRQLQEECDVRDCDFKPTSKAHLDALETRLRFQYEAGETLMLQSATEDISRCKRLYKFRHGSDYGSDDLCTARINQTDVVVPRYFLLINEVLTLKKLLS
jgi:hypothetical protein